ncbi:MAG: response regulator transcription factor [Sediminibacterium sp.]|jgi:two-component system nitrate/nitrite response regulator NarL|nr:response regulator transcription factor [Sediminibacterium sp.]MBX9781234.1 response regulator transcription factor [Chitinophagaceae bacterium]
MDVKINLMIADDHPLFVEGMKMILGGEEKFNISGIANDGKQLLYLLTQHVPTDLILLDVNMPNLNGLETIKYIKQSFGAVKVLMLSAYSDEKVVQEAKSAGADGYILKSSSKAELHHAIMEVYSGKSYFSVQKEINYDDAFKKLDAFLRKYDLTKREKEILLYLKQTYTNQQIAEKLHLSIYTVETHRKNIMQKLKLNSPAALVKFMIEFNL